MPISTLRGVLQLISFQFQRRKNAKALKLFRQASQRGDITAIDAILRENKIDPKQLFGGRNLLVEVLSSGASTEVVQHLINVGVPDMTDQKGFNPLVAATICSSSENLKLLIDAGFSETSATGKRALTVGIQFLSGKNVCALVKAGMSVADFTGQLPLELDNEAKEILKAAGFKQDEENDMFTNPKSVHCLRDICRNTIRRSIKTEKNLLFQIAQLSQIPKPLKRFLVFYKASF